MTSAEAATCIERLPVVVVSTRRRRRRPYYHSSTRVLPVVP